MNYSIIHSELGIKNYELRIKSKTNKISKQNTSKKNAPESLLTFRGEILHTKPPPNIFGGGNEKICERQSRVVGIPVIAKPVVVRDPLTTVPIQVTDIKVAIAIAVFIKNVVCATTPRKFHNDFEVEYYSVSKYLNIFYQVFSFFYQTNF